MVLGRSMHLQVALIESMLHPASGPPVLAEAQADAAVDSTELGGCSPTHQSVTEAVQVATVDSFQVTCQPGPCMCPPWHFQRPRSSSMALLFGSR